MKYTGENELIIHVDVDSPVKLFDFYQIGGIKYDQSDLESFYETFLNRTFEFFEKYNLKVTFFMVGNELENSGIIRNLILQAGNLGHEIENHSYSHPFGLAGLSDDEITAEINKCSDIIFKLTGLRPVGFRAPGYSINTKIINILKENGFKYDSSGFWSIMNPVLEYGHKFMFKNGLKNEGFGYVTGKIPHEPYFTDQNDWLRKDNSDGHFLEIPLPRTKFFGLPFYNNINLWAPDLYSNIISKTIRRKKLIYLFHAIEFVDLSDNVPSALSSHPNLKKPALLKIEQSGKIISNLLKRYRPVSTRQMLSGN